MTDRMIPLDSLFFVSEEREIKSTYSGRLLEVLFTFPEDRLGCVPMANLFEDFAQGRGILRLCTDMGIKTTDTFLMLGWVSGKVVMTIGPENHPCCLDITPQDVQMFACGQNLLPLRKQSITIANLILEGNNLYIQLV